jgi:SAM-dependent methyltransferase
MTSLAGRRTMPASVSRVIQVSSPRAVNMADEWFEVADLNHFWIRRRFRVARFLLQSLGALGDRLGEIGCGNGLVQRQVEEHFGLPVEGIDLNLAALQQNVSRSSPLFFYDIFDRHIDFHHRYDVLFLFDVIEHLEDDRAFLEAALEMLKPGGVCVINVPARQDLYSEYDRRAGHLRRYSLESLKSLVQRCGLQVRAASYWGMTLLPLLWLRKRVLQHAVPEQTIRIGFSPRNKLLNELLSLLANLEGLPNLRIGTSIMLCAQKKRLNTDNTENTEMEKK